MATPQPGYHPKGQVSRSSTNTISTEQTTKPSTQTTLPQSKVVLLQRQVPREENVTMLDRLMSLEEVPMQLSVGKSQAVGFIPAHQAPAMEVTVSSNNKPNSLRISSLRTVWISELCPRLECPHMDNRLQLEGTNLLNQATHPLLLLRYLQEWAV